MPRVHRPHVVTFRASAAELDELRRRAKRQRVDVSDVIRGALFATKTTTTKVHR